jgi:hypothetical protein
MSVVYGNSWRVNVKMIDDNYQRYLQNAAEYLANITLTYGRFRQTTEDDDHAHCELCFAKFMDAEYRIAHDYVIPKDILTEGYHSEDGGRWICSRCVEEYRGMFGWRVVDDVNPADDRESQI